MYYLLLTINIHAKELYYYDSNEIAPLSKTFVNAQSQLFPKYESLEKEITKYDVGIKKMETMMFLSDSDDGKLYEQFINEKKQFVGQKIQFQKRSEQTINGYGEAFLSAVQTEIQSNWIDAVECSEKQSLIMGMQLNKETVECQGRNISTELAQGIDKNPVLQSEIDKINKAPWPNISLPNLQQTLGSEYMYLSMVSEYFYSEELKYQKALRRQEIDKLGAQLQSEDEAQKKEAIAQAEQINQNYRIALLSYGQQIHSALEKMEKDNIAICYTPKEFEGCSGTNVSNDMIAQIEGHRKAYKIIKKKKN
jgi:hypothetical protein